MRRSFTTCLVALLFVAAACGDSAARRDEACGRAVGELISGLQAYVDGFAGMTPERFAKLETQPPRTEVQASLIRYRARVRRSGCEPAVLGRHLSARAGSLRGTGVIAETIATTLRTTLLRLGQPDGAQKPEIRRVAPGSDLAAAVASVIPGSRLILEAGVHRISRTLVVLESTTIAGEGKDKTRIISSAPGAAIIFLGDGAFGFENLSIAHSGRSGASLVVLRSGSYVIRHVRVSDAKQAAGGIGGIGIVVGLNSGATGSQQAPARTMRIENSEFLNNAASGITIGGRDAPTVQRTTVSGSGACGVCFVGNASGTLRDSNVVSNRIGVTSWNSSRPTIDSTHIARNSIGVHVRDRAAPTVIANTLSSNRSAGIVWSGGSTGRGSRNTCSGPGPGIVLLERSRPSVSGNRCPTLDNRT